MCVLAGYSNYIRAVCFSPDGTLIASGCSDGKILVWETRTSQCVYTLSGHVGEVTAVCFSPDGGLITSGDSDGQIIVWEVGINNSATSPDLNTARNDEVTQVFYSADLATIMFENGSGFDCWNVISGERVAYDSGRMVIGPRVVYTRSVGTCSKELQGLACYGAKLEGAIVSKENLDLLKSRMNCKR